MSKKSNYQKTQEILERAKQEAISGIERLAKRSCDVSYVIQDLDWEKGTAPELAIYFCQQSGLTSVKLTVARGESHEDSVAISDGHDMDTIKSLLDGYIDIFKTALESMEHAPQ